MGLEAGPSPLSLSDEAPAVVTPLNQAHETLQSRESS